MMMMMKKIKSMMVKTKLSDLLSCGDITDVEGVVQNVKSLVFKIGNIGTLFMIVMIMVIIKIMMMMTHYQVVNKLRQHATMYASLP